MKLASVAKIMLGSALALMMLNGAALARSPRSDQSGTQQKDKYPNATRTAPKLDLTSQADADNVNKGLAAVQANDAAKARTILQPLADGTKTNSKYAQALALQGLATVDFRAGNKTKAIEELNKALKIGVMPNQTYFDLEYELAQFYLVNGNYQKSLDTVQKWRDEGKLETADSYALQGKDYYQLGQYAKAIAAIKKAKSMTDKVDDSWNQVLAASYAETGNSDEAIATAKAQLAKHPNDMTTLHNTVSLLVSAGKYDQAMDLMQQSHDKGNFVKGEDYVTLAKLHLMKAQEAKNSKPQAREAVDILKEGISKGLVKKGYESNKIEGDAAYLSDDIKGAIEDYARASKDAPNGQIDLQRARLLISQNKYGAGRDAARQALKRGLKHKGEAYMVIAESERAMHNKSAAIAAMRKAELDPTTRDEAKSWLKKVSH